MLHKQNKQTKIFVNYKKAKKKINFYYISHIYMKLPPVQHRRTTVPVRHLPEDVYTEMCTYVAYANSYWCVN